VSEQVYGHRLDVPKQVCQLASKDGHMGFQ
jgi:hypothetical protein